MSDPSQVSPVKPGDTLLGRYRVERVLGVGGMGVVVAARHLTLDSLVAVKFLLPDILSNPEAVSRFAREAKAAVKIQNEHVSRVTDVGSLENGAPYMVMEYLEGSDLGVVLRAQGRLPIADAVDFVLQASEAIAEAHSLGIVHRDLKPANLFLVRRSDGSRIVKVLDFGISKTSGLGGPSTTAAMTSTASMMGSPLYMSPEQLNSARDVDARTDIWSLGIILYELLTAKVPFVAETIPQLCVAIMQGQPASLRAARPEVPPGLEAVVLRCLAKDRASRFADIGSLARALSEFAPPRSSVSVERIIHLLSTMAAPVPVDSSDTGSTLAPRVETVLITGSGIQAAWGHTAPASRASKRRTATIAALIAMVLVSAALLFLRSRSLPIALQTPTAAASGASTIAPVETSPPRLVPEEEPLPNERDVVEPPREPAPSEGSTAALSSSPPHPSPIQPPRKPKVRNASPTPPAQPGSPPQRRRDLPGSGLE